MNNDQQPLPKDIAIYRDAFSGTLFATYKDIYGRLVRVEDVELTAVAEIEGYKSIPGFLYGVTAGQKLPLIYTVKEN